MRVLGIEHKKYMSKASFGRKPTDAEASDMQKTINNAYDIMGTKERIAITHGSCFPAGNKDSYIGSPFSKAANEYIKFLALYGFNGNQLGPNGELVRGNNSPYNSSAFAKNRLFIDLQALKNNDYAGILSKEDTENLLLTPEHTEKNYTYTNFDKANEIYDSALDKAFSTFRTKLKNKEPNALELNKEFQMFLKSNDYKNDKRLTEEGIFNVLAEEYGTDNFEKWTNNTDKNLILLTKQGDIDANIRYNTLYNDNKKDIEKYKFEQFIATKQIKENKEFRDKIGFKYFSDMLVGCSKMDYWRHQDAFIKGYQIGAYEYMKNPQIWDSPILHPRKLFKGSNKGLGTAGLFLKEKIDNALEFCENVRVDHVMGLIEPYVIDNSSIIYNERGKIINTPDKNPVRAEYMSNMKTPDGKPLDDYKNYSCDFTHKNGYKTFHSNIMNEIVLPALKAHNLAPEDVVWEDLCSQPEAFKKVYYENLHLPRLVQTEWARVQGGNDKDWYLLGSHDSIPGLQMIKRFSINKDSNGNEYKDYWTKNSNGWNPDYLAGYLNMSPSRIEERNNFRKQIINDDKERVKAKFAELLTTKKFQISFADILGIVDDDVVYNIGGTSRKDNWKLRIPADFIDKYYENLSSDNPTAINIPEVLKMALQAKLDMLTLKAKGDQAAIDDLNQTFRPVIDKLAYYENILKE